MRIDRLDLIAYGRFKDVSLDLSGGERGLHVIHGPNEAGKSTSLRALEGWLYEFPHQLDDNFRHRNDVIRVGGVLRDEDGSLFESIRRKTKLRSLRGADDDADADDEVLRNRLLGGVDRKTFVQRFTINHKSLSEGGKAALEQGGEFATILFGSGLDLDELRRYRKALRDETESLFKPTGEKPSINKHLRGIADQEKVIAAVSLRGPDWTEGIDRRDELIRLRDGVDGDWMRASAERARLNRIRQAHHDLPRRDQLQRELSALAEIPRVSADFGDRLRAVERARDVAEAIRSSEARSASRSRAELADLPPRNTLLDDGDAIRLAHSQISGHEQAERNRDQRSRDRHKELSEARRYLRELGRDEDPETIAVLVPRRNLKAILEQRREERDAIDTELKEQGGADRTAEERLDSLQRELDRPPPPSPNALSRAIHRARALGDSTDARDRIANDLKKLKRQADILRGRVKLDAEPEMIAGLAVPSREVLETHRDAMNAVVAAATTAREQYDADENRLLDLVGEMARTTHQSELPEESELPAARSSRDAAWQAVKAGDQGQSADNVAAEFEAAIRFADEIADRLRASAGEIAARAVKRAEKQHLVEALEIRRRRKAEAVEALARVELRGTQVWAAVGSVPASPLEMIDWQSTHAQLVAKYGEIVTARDELDAIDEERSHAVAGLHRELEALGEPVLEGEPLPSARQQAEDVLLARQAAVAAHAQTLRDRDEAKDQRANATAELVEIQKRLDAWKVLWSGEVEPLGLDAGISPDNALNFLQSLTDLNRALTQAAKIAAEIEGLRSDSEGFVKRVTTLAVRHSSDLGPDSSAPATILERLVKRLTDAEAIEGTRNDLLRAVRKAELSEQEASSKLERAGLSLVALAKEAGVDSGSDLAAIDRLASQRAGLEQNLNTINEHLAAIAPGKSPDEVTAEARETPADGLPAEMERLDDQIQMKLAERRGLDDEIGAQKARLERMEQDACEAGAEIATLEREHFMGLLGADVDRYVHLRLAQAVLNGAIAAFREQNEAPVLACAGNHFARLTRGSFRSLGADADDKGDPFLVGVRPDGIRVGVGGMSTATVDQLYLAMKLASMEHYIQTRPPLPLVVDDLLIQFDDERAAAALLCLADLSRMTQILFFTHHDHLVELARSRLPADTLFIHRL